MKKLFAVTLLIALSGFSFEAAAKGAASKNKSAPKLDPQVKSQNNSSIAKDVIDSFYKKYLGFKKTKTNKIPELPFSTSLKDLIAKNEKICKEKAAGEICGFGADGDIYLDAQDSDDNLDIKNTGYTSNEPEPGKIHVSFNLFPSARSTDGRTVKNITYSMIQENGTWVVDDILYSSGSARNQIQNEIDLFQK